MSLSLAENVIVAGGDNRPSMLDKTNYSSWASRMLLYTKGKEHGKLLVDSVLNGPFQYGTHLVPGNENTLATVRERTYTGLRDEKKICELVDIKATNIFLQDLPQDIYNLVNHNEHAKQIWIVNHPQVVHQPSYHAPALQQSYEAPIMQQLSPPSFPQLDSRLVVPSFNPSDDPIASLNKAMTFLSTTFASRYPSTNNQLRTSSNPRNQVTIQDGRVTVQLVQGRQTQGYTNSGERSNATNQGVNRNRVAGQAKVVKCYNCQEEAPAAFQTDDLDAFDYDCDDAPLAKAILMANLFSYDSNVLLEVPTHDMNLVNEMSYQSVQETQCSEQPSFDNETDFDITSDSNIISYEQYLQETENTVVQSTSSFAQQDELLMSVIKEMSSQVAKCNKVQQESKIVNETLTPELERYK
ncbi:hypothetical protein Tco_0974188 [Tanacetum coccineum]|uniref:Integrase, catalytic region, zinc finger, CCHC-type, peptidase aspartic, catalytic n=1 Tax=Tanacetum coccineum TaxID=301880 RepID=A0ABQ5EAW0_9ASTR